MDTVRITAAQQVDVADRVTFVDGRRRFVGHVTRKGRTYATVVTDDGQECRVPYPLLSRLVGAPRKPVQERNATLRAQFQPGDRVDFACGSTRRSGVLSRVNPRYAHVVCDDDQEYRVPYALLTPLTRQPDAAPGAPPRTDADLAALAAQARAWIAAHALEGWSFQFDHATTRAGCCQYDLRVISLAEAYAQSATDEAIADAILHEIAHALVGPAHGHDAVWRAQAQSLGCSGRRCHDVQFTPPRYIVACAQGCWVSTAERRQRGARCQACQGEVRYTTYTAARWQQATAWGTETTAFPEETP
ncbi:MAG: SprT-like domain-containing protein [Candidatus Tectimicrobiota bacterium]